MRSEKPMVVDCDTCPVRHVRCDDCLVTALQSLPVVPLLPLLRLADGELVLDAAEQRAVARFVAAGLVSADEAASVTARREPWTGVAATG